MTRRTRGGRGAAGLLVAGLLLAPSARAQVPPPPGARERGFLGRAGVQRAEELLGARDPVERRRALLRLGALGTPRARAVLVRWLQQRSPPPAELLVAAHAAAPHAAHPEVARVFAGWLGSADADPDARRARAVMALALARADQRLTRRLLTGALARGSPNADLIADAWRAHPPRSFDALLELEGAPSAALSRALGALGDQRALPILREGVRQADAGARAAAALALAELGDLEVLGLARRWASQPAGSVLERAALDVHCALGAPDCGRQLGVRLQRVSGFPELARWLGAVPGAVPLPALTGWLDGGGPARAPDLTLDVIAALGAHPADAALARLEAALTDPELRHAAAEALARSPAPGAPAVLGRLLARGGEVRGLGLLIAAIREHAGRSAPDWEGLAETSLADPSPVLRSLAAQALLVAEPSRRAAWLQSPDATLFAAAARHAHRPSLGPAAARALLQPLVRREQLAGALLHREVRDEIPTELLEELFARSGAARPLAALALAERFDGGPGSAVPGWLSHTDREVRRHAALGLGEARPAAATGYLMEAWATEADPEVRLALVAALLVRGDGVARRALRQAADLDPDARVRALARTAHASRTPLPRAGEAVCWVRVAAAGAPEPLLVQLGWPGGALLPAAPDPLGLVVIVGLPSASCQVSLAPAALPGDAPRVGRRGRHGEREEPSTG